MHPHLQVSNGVFCVQRNKSCSPVFKNTLYLSVFNLQFQLSSCVSLCAVSRPQCENFWVDITWHLTVKTFLICYFICHVLVSIYIWSIRYIFTIHSCISTFQLSNIVSLCAVWRSQRSNFWVTLLGLLFGVNTSWECCQ